MTAGGQDAIFPLCSSYHFLWYPRFRNPFLSPETMGFIGRDGTLGIHPRRKLKIWVQTQKLSLVSAYQLGWSPSSRDNIAAGIAEKLQANSAHGNCPPESHSEAHPALSSESTNLIMVLGGKGRTCITETSLKLSVTWGFYPHEFEE